MRERLYISDPYESDRHTADDSKRNTGHKAESQPRRGQLSGMERGKRSDMQGENASLPGAPKTGTRSMGENGFLSQEDGTLRGAATCPLTDCLVADALHELTQSLEQSRRSLRRLRGATRQCRLCPQSNACPSIAAFNAAIDAAVNELWEEWGGK
jgi:hypothetical protein